jgi:hypothetical protein
MTMSLMPQAVGPCADRFSASLPDVWKIYFLWRPTLPDASDDFVLELAVESESDCIITHNRRHFRGAERFGIVVVTPGQFLRLIGEIS